MADVFVCRFRKFVECLFFLQQKQKQKQTHKCWAKINCGVWNMFYLFRERFIQTTSRTAFLFNSIQHAGLNLFTVLLSVRSYSSEMKSIKMMKLRIVSFYHQYERFAYRQIEKSPRINRRCFIMFRIR